MMIIVQEVLKKKSTRKPLQSIVCPPGCQRPHNLVQTAYLLGVSEDTVSREIRDGNLQVVLVRRRRMVTHTEINEYLNRNKVCLSLLS
jgi:excisionase family DNA binding protein